VKTRIFIALLAIAAASGAAAKPDQAGIAKASGQATVLLYSVSQLMIAADMCSLGSRDEWHRVVDAVDRRYRFCAAQEPSWSGLLGDFKDAEAKSVAQGSRKSLGSFVVEKLLEGGTAEARAMGKDEYCGRGNLREALEKGQSFIDYIRGLGTDTAWVEAPCDKDFWPPYAAGNK
jgi:hypothetical protein